MKIFTTLLIPALFLGASFAWAEIDEPVDLRYCLELQSNYEIAKCAGEVSPGSKGKPYSKEEVDMILSELQATATMSKNDLPVTPAMPVTNNDEFDYDLSSE